MPNFDDVSNEERVSVAGESANLLLQLQGPQLGGPGAPLVLGSTITEEMLTPEWVAGKGNAPLVPTGQAVSIVESKGPSGSTDRDAKPAQVIGYVRHVRGTGNANGPAQVTAASGSGIAGLIRDALDWIDANVPGSPTVRVVTAPAYQLTLLGLYETNALTGLIVVTPAPQNLPIENKRLYSPVEFSTLLSKTTPISGIEF